GGKAGVPAVGTGQDQRDDADRARTVEVVSELSASRASSYLAAESLYDVDGPQAGSLGAAVRSPQQLARHSSGWTAAPEESRALLSRQQLGALGGRYAGCRVNR